MPSASAKLEKQASTEALDPLKQILTMMEKKVRNLEKRKAKLDTYKSEFNSGKELNEDQKTAITKYDQVVEILEFAKELQKSFCTIVQDNVKLQKKAAKREHVERQQQEIQRLKEILLVQDVLVSMGLDNVRNDFLKGVNGAMQMSEEELNQLDELYKLVSIDHDSEDENGIPLDDQLSSAAEHLSALLEAKNKEVVGTTYKHLKDIILKIHMCGYFSHSETQEEEAKDDELHVDENAKGDSGKSGEGEEYVEEDDYDPTGVAEIVQSEGQQEEDALVMQTSGGDRSQVERPYFAVSSTTGDAPPYTNQNHSLQEVLPMQGSFNFLQESQIDLESPHMDPAVVVAHPIVPPPSLGYPGSQYPSTSQSAPSLNLSVQQHQRQAAPSEESNLGAHATPSGIPSAVTSTQVQQQPPSGSMTAGTPVALAQNPVNPPPDFDPSRPIPTQTFTNQNFAAAIHPMMAAAAVVPPSYVPVTISHGNIPQHMIAVGMVPPTVSPRGTPTPPPVSSSASPLPLPLTSQGVPSTTGQGVNLTAQQDTKDPFGNSEFQIHQASLDSGSSHASQVSVSQSSLGASSSQYQQVEDVQAASGSFNTQSQGSNFGQVRTGYGSNNSSRGNRARGSPNGFSRGSGRSSYGNGRTSRGGTGGRGGTSRGGRGSYRTQ